MDTFWNLDNSFKILISVLIIMTNLLLILVVTTSRKLRKQVSSADCTVLYCSYLLV